MKPKYLAFAVLTSSLALFTPAAPAEEPWIDLNVDSVEAGSPPPTAPFTPGLRATGLESVTVTDANKLEVVKDAQGFPGKALRFIKGSDSPRTPRAIFVNSPGLMTSGQVKFSWEAAINSFTPSSKFPGFEALMNFGLMDSTGVPFFSWYYVVSGDGAGGIFGCNGKKLGKWDLNSKQQFEITVDLDNRKAEITVDGTPVGETIELPNFNGLRVVHFTDGTGLAFYGSTYTATLAHFKMTKL